MENRMGEPNGDILQLNFDQQPLTTVGRLRTCSKTALRR